MAIRIGIPTSVVVPVVPASNPQWMLNGVPYTANLPRAWVAGTYRISTGRIPAKPIQIAKSTYPAVRASAYSDIFYNRILVEPIKINAGNVIAEKKYTIAIANLYFSPRTLTGITALDADGIKISAMVFPRVLQPLETIQLEITVDIAGPPRINAVFSFAFATPADNKLLNITGSRVVIFPFQFKPGMIESYTWKTGIIKSRNGNEQRTKLRRFPRQQFRVESYTDSINFIKIENLMFGWRGMGWALPLYHEKRNLTSPATTGALELNVDTRYAFFEAGGTAVVYQSFSKYDVFQIDTVAVDKLTLRQGILNDYGVDSFVAPIKISRMITSPVRRSKNWEAEVSAHFEMADPAILPAPAHSPLLYKGLDVITHLQYEVLKDDLIQPYSYERRVDEIEYGTTVLEYSSPWKYSEVVKRVRFVVEGLANIWAFKAWLMTRAGKFSPFWLPTYEPNFKVLSEGLLAASVDTVNVEYGSQSPARNHVAVVLKNGTHLLREVIGVSNTTIGNTQIAFDSAININRNDLDFICLLDKVRLETDNVELVWYQGEKIICDVPIRMLLT